MLKQIDAIIRQWLTAIAWFIIGHTLYKIIALIDWSKILGWSEKLGMQAPQVLNIIISYPFIIALGFLILRPKSSFSFLSHVKPLKILYSPPNWLFFWLGYAYQPLFTFLGIFSASIAYDILILCMLLILAIFFQIIVSKLIAYVRAKVYEYKIGQKRKIVVQQTHSLMHDVLACKEYEKNETILKKIISWAQKDRLTSYEADLVGINISVQKLKNQLTHNMQQQANQVTGIVALCDSSKNEVVEQTLIELNQEFGSKIVPIFITAQEINQTDDIIRLVLNRISFEIRKRIDVSGIVNLPNNWLEFVKSVTDSKLPNWFQSTIEQPPINQVVKDMSELIIYSDFHFVVIIDGIDKQKLDGYNAPIIQKLVFYLKTISGLSAVFTFDPLQAYQQNKALNYNAIANNLIFVPNISCDITQKIINILIFTLGPDDKNWHSDHAKKFPFIDNRECAILAAKPHSMQNFVRSLSAGWQNVKNEINFFDFFLMTFINIYVPPMRNFMLKHIELISFLINQKKKNVLTTDDNDCLHMLKQEWQRTLFQLSVEEQIVAQNIFLILFYEIAHEITNESNERCAHFAQVIRSNRIIDDRRLWIIALQGTL